MKDRTKCSVRKCKVTTQQKEFRQIVHDLKLVSALIRSCKTRAEHYILPQVSVNLQDKGTKWKT